MFISAVSRMSAQSNAFRFVDYDITQLDVQVLSELVGLRNDFVAPSYYIRGAITQLDSSVLASSQSAGMSLAQVGHRRLQRPGRLGHVDGPQCRPAGDPADHSRPSGQQLHRGGALGRGADVGGLIGKAGLSFSVSLDRSEGFAQAVRNLVELSTIEVLGKLARFPTGNACRSSRPTPPSAPRRGNGSTPCRPTNATATSRPR